MKPFAHITAATTESAPGLLGKEGRFFAGGIDLLGEMKEGIASPPVLVNLKRLPELALVSPPKDPGNADASWRIGANVTIAHLATNEAVRSVFPAIAQAARDVGSPQIRNVATLGGNLAQHSRCWYYRHRDVDCLKKGGATCYAREGLNRFHSLFSRNPCISPMVSNLGVALAALDARVVVLREGKEIAWTLAEFYEQAWVNPMAHNSLQPGDLITGVSIPVSQGTSSAYRQLSEKSEFDWALVSCAAAVHLEGGVVRAARVVLGAVAPGPHMRKEADDLLVGKPISEDTTRACADALLADALPLSENQYKIPIAKALVARVLSALAP